MQNNDLNVHVFQNRNPRCSPKSDQQFFSNFDCKKKKVKKYGAMSLFSEKKQSHACRT